MANTIITRRNHKYVVERDDKGRVKRFIRQIEVSKKETNQSTKSRSTIATEATNIK